MNLCCSSEMRGMESRITIQEITLAFTGFETVLSCDFERTYMQIENLSNISCYKIMVGEELTFSLLALYCNPTETVLY